MRVEAAAGAASKVKRSGELKPDGALEIVGHAPADNVNFFSSSLIRSVSKEESGLSRSPRPQEVYSAAVSDVQDAEHKKQQGVIKVVSNSRPNSPIRKRTSTSYAPGALAPIHPQSGQVTSILSGTSCKPPTSARESYLHGLDAKHSDVDKLDGYGRRATSAPDSQNTPRGDAWQLYDPLRTGPGVSLPRGGTYTIPSAAEPGFLDGVSTISRQNSEVPSVLSDEQCASSSPVNAPPMHFRPRVGSAESRHSNSPISPQQFYYLSSTPSSSPSTPQSTNKPQLPRPPGEVAPSQDSVRMRRRSFVNQGDSKPSTPQTVPASLLAQRVGENLLDDLVARTNSAPITLAEMNKAGGPRPSSGRYKAVNMLVDAVRSKDQLQLQEVLNNLSAPDGNGVAGVNDIHPVSGRTPLHEAVMINNILMSNMLMAAGGDPNVGHPTQGPPLLHAAAWGETDMVDLLLQSGADNCAADVAGYTALHYACSGGHVETAKLLIRSGADVRARTLEGETAFDLARDAVVRSLFEADAPSAPRPQHMSQPTFGFTPPMSPARLPEYKPSPPGRPLSSEHPIARIRTLSGRVREDSPLAGGSNSARSDVSDDPHTPPPVLELPREVRRQLSKGAQLQDIIHAFEEEEENMIRSSQERLPQQPPQSNGGGATYVTSAGTSGNQWSNTSTASSSAIAVPVAPKFRFGIDITKSNINHDASITDMAAAQRDANYTTGQEPPLVRDQSPVGSQHHSPAASPPGSPKSGYIQRTIWMDGVRDSAQIQKAATALASHLPGPSTSQEAAQIRAAQMFSKSVELRTGDMVWTRGELLGEGAYGKVFAGLNQQTGELMAVKILELINKSGESKQQLAELQQELELYKKLKHKHVVGYIDAYYDPKLSTLYIFLEYVPGGSIFSMLERFGKFSEELVRNYTRQLLMGLEYLHGARIVHRDLKGGNILVTRDGIVKLADFGASKAYKDATITDGMKSLRGSVFWMAPEVIKGTGYGRRADVWSLGCTVIEMLSGKHPWPELDNHWSAMFQIAKNVDGPPRPEHITDLARDFLDKCLEYDPKQRPTAAELLHHPFVAAGPMALQHATQTTDLNHSM